MYERDSPGEQGRHGLRVVFLALNVESKSDRETLDSMLCSEIPGVDTIDSLNLAPRIVVLLT